MSELAVEVSRNNIRESAHRADIVVLNNKKQIIFSLGDPFKTTYMRSCAKSLQAIPVILDGCDKYFELNPAHIAITCGSHFGEEFHIKILKDFLDKIGLKKHNLLCGISTSRKKEYALKLARKNVKLSQLYNDCSGKHLGMLSLCVKNNYSIKNYIKINHPVQKRILNIFSKFAELDKNNIKIGIDGCSAPVFAIPLFNMAISFLNFVNPVNFPIKYQSACNKIYKSIVEHPEMISGTNGFCTELIKHTKGKLIGKIGAQGVYCVGVKNRNIAIALKVEDGSLKAVPPIVIHILKNLNIINKREYKKLKNFHIVENINKSNEPVGKIKPCFRVFKNNFGENY